MRKHVLALLVLFSAITTSAADTVVMRVGNVLGDPEPGREPHHIVRTQRYFAKLVWEKTGGSVEVRFLEGKSLPTFQMPAMVGRGEIEATNAPGFFFIQSARARRPDDSLPVRRARACAPVPTIAGSRLPRGEDRRSLRCSRFESRSPSKPLTGTSS